MFKYTKRFFSDIRFWCQELKLRRKEDAELERIIDDMEGYGGHGSMAGFGYYQTMKRNRTERKRLHAEERAAIK